MGFAALGHQQVLSPVLAGSERMDERVAAEGSHIAGRSLAPLGASRLHRGVSGPVRTFHGIPENSYAISLPFGDQSNQTCRRAQPASHGSLPVFPVRGLFICDLFSMPSFHSSARITIL